MSSFPASKYARYKRATAFFLDWLLRARGRGRPTDRRVKLDELTDLVEEIAADPSTLSPQLLRELPKALAAGQCAIRLRQHVATFFGDEDDDGHRHFLELLQNWHERLLDVGVERDEEPTVESKNTKSDNYYELLEVDEDEFPDEDTFLKDKGASQRVKTDRKRLFEEAFAEDLRLEVVYYFLELEELLDGVFDIYDQVKKGARSIVEATVVVKVAMELADGMTARLQVRYPALRTAEDVLVMVTDNIPATQMSRIVSAVIDARRKFEKDKICRLVPGMLLVEFSSVLSTLTTFVREVPKSLTCNVYFPDGFYGENYGEERTPEYVLPELPGDLILFVAQQLPLLYNFISVQISETGSGYGEYGLASSFLALIEGYLESGKVSVSVVFAFICWMKAVEALQGNADLGRNVSLAFMHSTQLMTILEEHLDEGSILTAFDTTQFVTTFIAMTRQSSHCHYIARANPLMAGFMMLDNDFQFLPIVNLVAQKTPTFRALVTYTMHL